MPGTYERTDGSELNPSGSVTDTDTGSFRSRVLSFIPEYIAVVRELAEEFGAVHVRTHEKFQELLRTPT